MQISNAALVTAIVTKIINDGKSKLKSVDIPTPAKQKALKEEIKDLIWSRDFHEDASKVYAELYFELLRELPVSEQVRHMLLVNQRFSDLAREHAKK